MRNTKLLCIDFDQTIVNGHFHNELSKKIKTKKIKTKHLQKYKKKDLITLSRKLLDETGGFKNPEKLSNLIKEAIDKGYKIAITSFTKYEDIIKPTLEQAPFGLEKKYLDQIFVVGGYPSKKGAPSSRGSPNHQDRKEQHIQKAMQHFKLNHPENVVLIDDSNQNIKKARLSEHQAIQVPREANADSKYLQEIKKFITTDMRNQNSTKVQSEKTSKHHRPKKTSRSAPLQFSRNPQDSKKPHRSSDTESSSKNKPIHEHHRKH